MLLQLGSVYYYVVEHARGIFGCALYSVWVVRIPDVRLFLLLFSLSTLAAQSDLGAARAARDSADAAGLRARVAAARKDSTLAGLLKTAQLNSWLCEALYASSDARGVKRAAQAGVDAAERAVRADPNSSEAHRLLGDLMAQLIPHVFAGGMRFGARSTRELERALELEPRNAEAHVARAISYFMTPSMFGGDKQKALEHLGKAIELDAANDTAYLWMAQIHAELKQKELAAAEINAALRINPNRGYTRYLAEQLGVKL